MISVVLIGTGNVAKQLFDVFSKNSLVQINQVVGRNMEALKNFGSAILNIKKTDEIEDADIFIIAVSDSSIAAISKKLEAKQGLVVHTSGSVPLQVLSKNKNSGVFYPLQTFSKDRMVDFESIPICIESKQNENVILLKKLGKAISKKVYEITSEQRKSLHLAAVFANNFTNHMYHLANEICEANGVPFEILKPLIKETATKIDTLSPIDAQTGPAKRNDETTLMTHLSQLDNETHKKVYQILTESIKTTHGEKL